MKKLFTLFLIFTTILLQAQEQYSRARVQLDGKTQSDLSDLGIDFHEGTYKKGVYFETDFSQSEILRLRDAGFKVDVSIQDVTKFYRERAEKDAGLPE